jgi:DNA-binding XRE family transcriptional regulator
MGSEKEIKVLQSRIGLNVVCKRGEGMTQKSGNVSTIPKRTKGHVGERLLLLRHRHGWTQGKLASMAGIAPETVWNIELGGSARLATLEALATALECTVSYLLTPID